MSNQVNDKLMDKVEELLSYWEGTLHERVLRRDLEANDLEALQYHVDQAWKEMCIQEDFGWFDRGSYDCY